MSFGDATRLDSPLTLDRTLLATVITNLTARGETALYDAVVFAQTLFSGGTTDKQLVLLSDGGDTVSNNDLAQATAVASTIKTNVIELTSSEANHAALEQLAGPTVAPSVHDRPDSLARVVQAGGQRDRHRYRCRCSRTATGR